ncbi:hypothetical protein M9H77_08029 [Catharanthus roseus]|uniref:Uncharacterized protein n=1 Tax=Catharanthus roseus TaxID=4058 RepID=A0ACC0BWT9_CATRO|nr:hypothetical protein M9H77_08029 [Catharanthus roseus]
MGQPNTDGSYGGQATQSSISAYKKRVFPKVEKGIQKHSEDYSKGFQKEIQNRFDVNPQFDCKLNSSPSQDHHLVEELSSRLSSLFRDLSKTVGWEPIIASKQSSKLPFHPRATGHGMKKASMTLRSRSNFQALEFIIRVHVTQHKASELLSSSSKFI